MKQKSETTCTEEITDYFRANIFESLACYTAWKIILGSRSTAILPQDIAERYVEIQNIHHNFFPLAEHAFLFQFVIQVLHSFDKRDDSYSLYKVDPEKTLKFVRQNDKVITALKNVRNKVLAHRDMSLKNTGDYQVPSFNDLDVFFQNLKDFYNSLTKIVDDSSTIFDNAYDVKYDIENLYMNIFRGESVRKNEVDIEWAWLENKRKASDLL